MNDVDVDALIRALIHGDRQPTDGDATTILDHIARSTFYSGRHNIPRPLQDLMIRHGYEVPERGDDLIFHWAKHVLADQQWMSQTSPEQYFADARNAVMHPASRLVLQNPAPRHYVAIVIASTSDIVPVHRRGARAGEAVLVVYSASTGRMLSVYMADSPSELTARPSTVWLRR